MTSLDLTRVTGSLTAIAFLICPGTAQAQSLGDSWEGYFGLGASSGPTYSGSDETEVDPGLEVDLTWNQRLFLRTDTGIGFYALNGERSGGPLSFGFAIGYDFDERTAADDNRLSGLTDVEAGAALRAFLEYEIGVADLEILASRGLSSSGHEGTTVEASLGFDVPISERTIITIAPFVTWANGAHTNAFYGVSSAEAAASGYTPYSAGAGLQEAGLEIGAAHFLTEQFGLYGLVEYSTLLGDAKDSPITFDDTAFELAAGVIWRF